MTRRLPDPDQAFLHPDVPAWAVRNLRRPGRLWPAHRPAALNVLSAFCIALGLLAVVDGATGVARAIALAFPAVIGGLWLEDVAAPRWRRYRACAALAGRTIPLADLSPRLRPHAERALAAARTLADPDLPLAAADRRAAAAAAWQIGTELRALTRPPGYSRNQWQRDTADYERAVVAQIKQLERAAKAARTLAAHVHRTAAFDRLHAGWAAPAAGTARTAAADLADDLAARAAAYRDLTGPPD